MNERAAVAAAQDGELVLPGVFPVEARQVIWLGQRPFRVRHSGPSLQEVVL